MPLPLDRSSMSLCLENQGPIEWKRLDATAAAPPPGRVATAALTPTAAAAPIPKPTASASAAAHSTIVSTADREGHAAGAKARRVCPQDVRGECELYAPFPRQRRHQRNL